MGTSFSLSQWFRLVFKASLEWKVFTDVGYWYQFGYFVYFINLQISISFEKHCQPGLCVEIWAYSCRPSFMNSSWFCRNIRRHFRWLALSVATSRACFLPSFSSPLYNEVLLVKSVHLYSPSKYSIVLCNMYSCRDNVHLGACCSSGTGLFRHRRSLG